MVAELRTRRRLPAGQTGFSVARTRQFMADPLSLLLPSYERYGPVFSLRVFHERVVFLLGPAANHFVLVSGADNFSWREGDYSQLVPLIGDGLLTTDGAYHDQARRLMLPAFHQRAITASLKVIESEAEQAVALLTSGRRLDLYAWARRLAMRIAMRALLGLDPDDQGAGARAATLFERALSFYSTSPWARSLRGPGSAWRRMLAARTGLEQILDGEIRRRRESRMATAEDVLGLLTGFRDPDGGELSEAEIRDQLMTLAFAGHDTATSTLTFLIYELARHPDVLGRVWKDPTSELDMALDETLRLYPPAWIGPRRVTRGFEFAGQTVPAGAYAAYSSWASHRLPEVFPEPDRFRPERFAPPAKAALPKGAYVPFGGGSRTCIGMRFGQAEVKIVASALLERFAPELPAGFALQVRQMPTLGPAAGLPVILRAR